MGKGQTGPGTLAISVAREGVARADVTITFLAPTDTFIEAAGRWFLKSGIQEAQRRRCAILPIGLGQNSRVSTEITGYTVSALLFLYQRTGDPGLPGRWPPRGALSDSPCMGHAVRARFHSTAVAWRASAPAFAYFFDCGIIVRGLLCLAHDGRHRIPRHGHRGGRAMLADFP